VILLDTSVISEVMRRRPELAVTDWLNAMDAGMLHVSAVTIGEIEYGLDNLPAGQRRDTLRARFDTFLDRAFRGRILPYDGQAARHYGWIMGGRRRSGHPVSAPDGQIAAIASARGMAVATRNTRDFAACGLDVINPWVDGGAV